MSRRKQEPSIDRSGICDRCGVKQTGLRKHWDQVHQKTARLHLADGSDTKISRNMETGLFHCPQCNMGTEFAHILRKHTIQCDTAPSKPSTSQADRALKPTRSRPTRLASVPAPPSRPSTRTKIVNENPSRRTRARDRPSSSAPSSAPSSVPVLTASSSSTLVGHLTALDKFLMPPNLALSCKHLKAKFQEFGIRNQDELDALAKEEEMWSEFGEYLLRHGATRMEWLLIKAGLGKRKAKL